MYAVHGENQAKTRRHFKLSSASTVKSHVSKWQRWIRAATAIISRPTTTGNMAQSSVNQSIRIDTMICN